MIFFSFQIFVRLSSHLQLSILCTSHQAFGGGKYFTKILRNCNLIVLWNFLSDKSQLIYLNKRYFPYRSQFLEKCFEKAYQMLGRYAYLVINCSPDNILSHLGYSVSCNVLPFKNNKDELIHEPIYFRYNDAKLT